MKIMHRLNGYFTVTELFLWLGSMALIIISFAVFDRENWLTLAASLIGVSSLILAAKGNPASQLLMVVFSILYGIISYSYSYYGEMLTYLGMTMPMSVISFVSWIRNLNGSGSRPEVNVRSLSGKDIILLIILTAAVTALFYFVLKFFGAANLIPSTISVTTSFAAVFLTFLRSSYFALAYAANDAVLIILWTLAARENIQYISVVICFVMFLANDIYGFMSWLRRKKRQQDSGALSRR